MKRISKQERRTTLEIIGQHIEKFHLLISLVLGFLVLGEIAFIIFWSFDPVEYLNYVDYIYLATQCLHVLIASGLLVCVILNYKKEFKTIPLVILFHAYAFFLMAWGTFLCIADMSIGLSPIIYLLIATAVVGLLVIEPFYFLALALTSITAIIIFQVIRVYPYFSGDAAAENIANFTLFFLVIIAISFRLFNVTISEQKAINKLERLARYDELTDLYNEM